MYYTTSELYNDYYNIIMILYYFLYNFKMEPKYDILMTYFLKLITMMSAWKIKNQLILNQEESAMLLLEGDEEEVK